MQVFKDDVPLGHELQELEREADEGGGFLLPVGAAQVGHVGGAVAEGGFVDGEALLFPEVGVDDAVEDGLVEEVGGVEAVDCAAGVAVAVVEEVLDVGLVSHGVVRSSAAETGP